ncbi:MAG: hypothetical protein OZ914_03690 [Anaerolineaceae bacterium]|jgi:hypothetical protein|nr:hypothetical protein [Anaerolineaceae bacterium]OQY89006.1 MAG: hypothetical protein B6D38_08175 [Anaerolineae bacterium UTCFX1]
MKNFQQRISTFASRPFAIPLVLLIVTVLAYGLSFWRLGFYWDDQPISWIRYELGTAATTKYFSDSRPVWALLYQLTGFILPANPAVWQLFAMFWRWAGVAVFYLMMARLLPNRKPAAFFLSLFVLLYPGFNQQWVSYVYSHFFIVLFFLLISFYLMLRGKTIPAMIFSAAHLLMFEYFFLLEFMRPIVLFASLRDEPLTLRERIVKTLKAWIPYLGVIIFVLLYRSLVYSHPGFGYSLTEEVVRAPIETITQLVQHVLTSLWSAAVGAWIQIFQFPNPNINGIRTSALYIVVVLLVGACVFIIARLKENESTNAKHESLWFIALGAVMLLLGGVPYWVTNLPVTLGFPANRALLSFMFGACFFLIGLIQLLPARIKYVVAVLIVALSAGRQFLWSVDYLRDWESQKNLFWQMQWRAPSIEPDTLVLMNESLEFSADNSISAAVNWIYDSNPSADHIKYALFYPVNRLGGSLPSLDPNMSVTYNYTAGKFHGNTSDALAFYYAPPFCLRLLDPDLDSNNRFISDFSLMRQASALSNPQRILREPVSAPPAFYGVETSHGWCYYFQKAELARQFGDWDEVNRLAKDAFSLNEHFNNPVELFVFIEGYAHADKWDDAIQLSKEAHRVSKSYVDPLLCKLWKRIEAETPSSEERDDALKEIFELTGCNP